VWGAHVQTNEKGVEGRRMERGGWEEGRRQHQKRRWSIVKLSGQNLRTKDKAEKGREINKGRKRRNTEEERKNAHRKTVLRKLSQKLTWNATNFAVEF